MSQPWWKSERWWSAVAAGIALGVITIIVVRLLGWPLDVQVRAGLVAFAFGFITELIRIASKVVGMLIFATGVAGISAFIVLTEWHPNLEGRAPLVVDDADYGVAVPGGTDDPAATRRPGPMNGTPSGGEDGRTAAGTEPPGRGSDPAEAPAVRRSDWLQTAGTTIFYRHSLYLAGACGGEPTVTGNFLANRDLVVPADCIDSHWMAFDAGPHLRDGRVERNVTYCVVFQDEDGRTGSHAAAAAPGSQDVVIPGRPDAPIGFRVTRRLLRDRIELTNRGHEARPC